MLCKLVAYVSTTIHLDIRTLAQLLPTADNTPLYMIEQTVVLLGCLRQLLYEATYIWLGKRGL
ncbi:hypothetical protein A9Y76_07905 [Ralstonia insidiosa]|uniref:Uncharacterized protein n=1 Tax=Ralstonia insidiosa TaxID=190721 RepID=A0A191ZWD9_9RALS|nr:hypothetical protein A9Y76_07905 [Ralstonia insidiosa]